MSKLPLISGKKAARAFEKDVWIFSRQHGSHMIYEKSECETILSIPDHRELDKGLLRHLIKDAQLTVDDFIALT
ncbi:MAG: type II toxin-antitoxin system HicA family toxin [Candidatus Desantisbacteria bacterium]